MTTLTPEQMLKKTNAYFKNLEAAKKKAVFVGLPVGTVGKAVYKRRYKGKFFDIKNPPSVLEVGAGHEYGIPGKLPRRSWLRVPFAIKQKELALAIEKQFKDVFEGKDHKKALGLIGVKAQSISQEAFITKGYGTWPDIKQETKDNKGSSQVLVDQSTLKNSITWVIR